MLQLIAGHLGKRPLHLSSFSQIQCSAQPTVQEKSVAHKCSDSVHNKSHHETSLSQLIQIFNRKFKEV